MSDTTPYTLATEKVDPNRPRDTYPTRITHAAVMYDGRCWVVNPPGRHHHIIHHLAQLYGGPIVGVEGFMTDTRVFARREPALAIALRNGQIAEDGLTAPGTGKLFSEDLW